jgi:PAS domain S-box-containing protein
MNYEFTNSFFLQSLPCLFAFTLIYILWKRKHVKGVLYLILFECSTALWAITDSLEHAATSLSIKIFWSQFAIIGASTIPVFFLLFTLAFTQHDKFNNWRSVLFLLTIPIITIIFTFTNPYHHLIWEKVELLTQENGSVYHYGKWFWIYVYYEFVLVVLVIITLFLSTLRFYKIYKTQIIYLIVACVVPLAVNVLYTFKLTSIKADLTPISLIFTGIFVAIGIYKQGMIDIIPLARKQIIDNLNDGMIVIDMADRIIDANPAITAITGKIQEQLIGKPFGIIREMLFHTAIDYSTRTRFNIETVITVDNEQRYFEVTYNPITDMNQRLIGRIFILRDITIRKMALDSAVELNNQLRKEIQEKENLIFDLDAYARSVAHDLKNPISGLLGISEGIKYLFNQQKQEEAFELLDMAHKQGLKMFKIVDELLLLSRIRKEDIQPVSLDMSSIFDEARKRLNGQYEEKNVSIITPDTWPIVMGHPQWIEEVWFNFISNAVKYGGNPPLIKTGYDKINGSNYRFWIQDNGNGLPSESFIKIFSDFERLDRKDIEGHGLGLSIVKRIVEKLGGEVSVTSENVPGKGCIFSFTLRANIKGQMD